MDHGAADRTEERRFEGATTTRSDDEEIAVGNGRNERVGRRTLGEFRVDCRRHGRAPSA